MAPALLSDPCARLSGMTDKPNDEQAVPSAEAQQVAERHLPEILTQLGVKAIDGAVGGAAAYYVKKGLDKFGGRGSGDGEGQDQGPPEADPPT